MNFDPNSVFGAVQNFDKLDHKAVLFAIAVNHPQIFAEVLDNKFDSVPYGKDV
jgi:hypothetical protein